MINFRTDLRDQLIAQISDWLGPTSTSLLIKYIDKRLHDVELTQLPYLVVTVRHRQLEEEPEIGSPLSGVKNWIVHMYYLDKDADWDTGDDRQTTIVGLLAKRLEQNRMLGSIHSVDTEGNSEYVFDSEITDIVFDSTGVEGDYSFVSELFLTVKTDRR